MTPLALITALLAAASPAGERLAVLAVHDPPAPDGEISELAHQLRAAALDRAAGVLGAPEMRDRLAGRSGGASVQELDRAFGGALAVYQNGELESAARTLKAIVTDLEDLPESEAVWSQWTRAMSRLSHVYLSMSQQDELEATQISLLKVDSSHQLDPVLYAPGFRARFEEVRQRVRAMPKRRLTVTARGRGGTIYVSGRDVGPTPATVILPAGIYRVAGAAGALRIPSFNVDLTGEDRAVVLDFALAEAFRPSAGPGMLLPPAERAGAIIRAGAWLGVERLVTASRSVEGGAQFLVGAIYDVRRGALLREGSVRMISGGVPPASLGALASFLLTGQTSREVQDRMREPSAAPRPASPRPLSPVASAPPATSATAPAAARTAPTPAHSGIPTPTYAPFPPPAGPSAPHAAAPAGESASGVPAASLPAAPPPSSAGRPGHSSPTAAGTTPPPEPLTPASAFTPNAAARAGGSGSAAPPPAASAVVTGPAPAPAAPFPASAKTPAASQAGPPRPPPAATSAPVVTPAAGTGPSAGPSAPDLRPRPPSSDPGSRALAGAALDARPAGWLRPTAIGSGVLGVLLGGLAAHQGLAARRAWRDADAMVLPGGTLRPDATAAGHRAALDRGDAASRNAWVAGSGAVVSAAAAGVLFWFSRDPSPPR